MIRHGRTCLSTLMLALLLLGTSLPAHSADIVDAIPFASRAQEVRFQKLTRQLRCLVCQDESLAASGADLAKQMRWIVFKKMQAGWSDDQIKQFLADRYSDYVLYKPPLNKGTLLLWFGPGIILLLGAIVIFITVRTHRRHAPDNIIDDDDDW